MKKNQTQRVIELYFKGNSATSIAAQLGIDRKKVNQELLAMRIKLKIEVYPEHMIRAIFSTFEQELRSNIRFPLFSKSTDNSKAKAFLIYEYNRNVYTFPILNCSNYCLKRMTANLSKMNQSTLIIEMASLGIVGYNGRYTFLCDPSDRVKEFIDFSKERFKAINGISNKHFSMHLAETEYRFKNRRKNLAKEVFELMNNDLPF